MLVAAGVIGLALSSLPASAQFNPEGRRRAKPPASRPTPRAPSGPAQPPSAGQPPGPAKPAPAARDARDPEVLIARYRGILLKDPSAEFPLNRLAELYRERDGNLDKLIAEFVERAGRDGDERYASRVILAGLRLLNGEPELAIQAYTQAIDDSPKEPAALLALAHLLSGRGDKQGARARFEQVLPLLKEPSVSEQVLRLLVGLCLDLNDIDAAKAHHAALVRHAKSSFYVQGELARALFERGEYERAVAEYRELVKKAAGDARALAPALKDLGLALTKSGQVEEAVEVLQRALRSAAGESGVRREILAALVEVYRAKDGLSKLIAELEREHPNDFERLRLLGDLYEETGRVDQALKLFKQALTKNSKDLGTRLKVIQILQVRGDLDAALAEYEGLIAAAPRNPDFAFQFAEALIQRGDRARALAELQKLEARSAGDEDVQAALVDFYERIDEKARALALLEKLTRSTQGDPRHWIELGSRYWDQGDKAKAQATWERIKVLVPDRGKALDTLAEVYLEHDLGAEALGLLREAIKHNPKDLRHKRAYALALERVASGASARDGRAREYEDARRIWEELLESSTTDENARREARQHIVTLWGLSDRLAQRVQPLERRFQAKPPDLEAGRLLAEVLVRLGNLEGAERTLERVVELAPADTGSLLRLERVLYQQHKLERAIGVLTTLAKNDARRAREYYQRMAEYSALLYRDDDAIKYAVRAVDLAPDDAEAHRRLGEMYKQRQDTEHAIASFRQALLKNDRLFPAYFELADLLLGRGELDEADRLLRYVIRSAPDEELVARAARLCMQLSLGRGSLESLEQDLTVIALGNPHKPLYRRLLVEVYGALTFPLVQSSKSGSKQEREHARSELARLGDRATKPLLDALNDRDDSQQRISIELLTHIRNKSAAPALFAYAIGSADPGLRTRAMLSAGSLGDAGLAPKLRELLFPDQQLSVDESDPVALAAVWGATQLPGEHKLLKDLLAAEAPSARALAALGLGKARDRSAIPALREMAGDFAAGALARSAAILALAALGDVDGLRHVAADAASPTPLVEAATLVALSRARAGGVEERLAAAALSPEPEVARAALSAAVSYFGTQAMDLGALSEPGDRIEVERVLWSMIHTPSSATSRAQALIALETPLANEAALSTQSSFERITAVARMFLAQGAGASSDGSGTAPAQRLAFGAFTEDFSTLDPTLRARADKTLHAILERSLDGFIALGKHPLPEARVLSTRVLAFSSNREARRTVRMALDDTDAIVRRTALSAMATALDADATRTLAGHLGPAHDWTERLAVAQALASLPNTADPDFRSARTEAVEALARAALGDGYALVRAAALDALSRLDSPSALETARKLIQRETDTNVLRRARAVLQASETAKGNPP
jgi:cellulose synthase operon protein C